jgi:hypothetical protein
MAIRIPVVADVNDWLRGTRRISDSLDDIADDLRNVSRDGDQLERSLEDNFRDVARAADRAGRDVADGLDGGIRTSKAGDIGQEVAGEFTESFGEAMRSGNPADAVLDTFTSLGPALGALGIGAAVAAGIVNQFVQAAKERAEQVRSAAAGLYAGVVDDAGLRGREAAQAFTRGWVDAAAVPEQIAQTLGLEDAVEAGIRVKDLAEATGLSYQQVSQAILGNADALAVVRERLDANNTATDELYDTLGQVRGRAAAVHPEFRESAGLLREQRDELREIVRYGDAQAAANRRAADAQRVNERVIRDARDRARELNRELDNASRKSIRVPVYFDVRNNPRLPDGKPLVPPDGL